MPPANSILRFGPFEFDPERLDLRKSGHFLKLQPQPAKVLSLLLSRRGQVVLREDLQRELWGGETFVDFERSLNFSIRRLRSTLSDDPRSPKYIETVSRRGYRFVAEVVQLSRGNGDPALDSSLVNGKSSSDDLSLFSAQAVSSPVDFETNDSAVSQESGIDQGGVERGLRVEQWRIPLRTPLIFLGLLVTFLAVSVGVKMATRPPVPIRSLAVLPFQNLSHDPDQEYFADGITDELTTDLAKIQKLRVISRTSTMQYKNTHKALPEIAKELRVDAVLEGAVLRFGNKIRITAQLIEASSDHHLWAERYERNLNDTMVLQNEIARAVALQVDAKITSGELGRLGATRSIKAESHELYLRGRYVWNKRTEEGYRKAIEYFEKTAESDPESAEAYSGLADCYSSLPQLRVLSPTIGMPKAESFARKAIALDDSLAEAHASLAEVKELYYWDWAGAEEEYKRAIELRPSLATAHHWYAMYLNAVGRKNDALEEIEKAQLLDPVSLISDTNRGWILWCNRQSGQAIDQLRRTIELDPAFVNAHYKLGLVYETEGDYAGAVSEFSKQERLAGVDPGSSDRFEFAFTHGGWRGYCEERLASLQRQAKWKYVSPASFALAYLRLGDRERTFQWLEAAFDEHSEVLAYLKVDPRFDSLRGDKRFDRLLRRVGLTSLPDHSSVH